MSETSRKAFGWRRSVAAMAVALLASACSKQAPDDTLKVGMELAYPPFEMTDERNEPTGVSVEMAYALGEFLDRPVEIENIPFAGLIPALKTGKIDLIISSMTATEERAQSIAFSEHYLTTGLCLLVSKESDIESIGELDNPERRVAVKQGTTGHIFAANHFDHASVLLFEKESAAVLEVVQGKVDAFIYDQMSTYMNWRKHKETTRPLLDPFKREYWAVGLRKGDHALRAEVDAFIEHYREEGGFDRLGNKYLAEQKEAFAELGYPFFF